MLVRIVRMSFKEENVKEFIEIFNTSQPFILAFEGCLDVKLYRDQSQNNVYYTKSIWIRHEALEKYRNSELFKTTWSKTKILFDHRPQAFSLVGV
ncbi:MAG: antibiotic biosynthesis monooxygenase family protein [Saprospiraceae bacterium]